MQFWKKPATVPSLRGAGFFGLTALILITGCHRDISGSYLATDQNSVAWLQLVRTPDNHLTGQLAASIVKPDGTIEHSNVSVSGAVDGENVTLSGSGFLGLQSFILAGTLKGDTLTLTGAQPIPVTLKRATLTVYQQQIATLNTRSQAILKEGAAAEAAEAQQRATEAQERVQAETQQIAERIAAQAEQRTFELQEKFVSDIVSITGRMARFDSEADSNLDKFPNVEKSYEGITAKMQEYVERERQLTGNPNASAMRGQLSVAVSQGPLRTEEIHNPAVSLKSALDGNIKSLADQATYFEQQCRAGPNSSKFTPAEIQNIIAACQRLDSAVIPFRQKVNQLSAGLSHLEDIYRRERDSQQRLIQESQGLE
ncbi:hypothetical protein SBA5_360002 [Candidatus Sulfotelmatomonas gaucii]|uniref:Lipoprotein n=1 Tax=Candidatus Sulfuritelmatomonas gaucii TaxID=2043161 RepID=A0A2N9LI00_9BACT|nr:hypothetical protein SBA5_360002 [Candidatus Sulfotelmatomonas gaucii]